MRSGSRWCILGSISDENNDNTAAGSDLIPPAPQPNCAALNMESNDAVKMFIFWYPKKKKWCGEMSSVIQLSLEVQAEKVEQK